MSSDLGGGRPSSSRSGLMVENITAQLGDFFGVKDGKGVLVRSVEKGSRGEKAGFRAGDVVIKVNDQPVHDTSDFTHACVRLGHDGSRDRDAREERAESDPAPSREERFRQPDRRQLRPSRVRRPKRNRPSTAPETKSPASVRPSWKERKSRPRAGKTWRRDCRMRQRQEWQDRQREMQDRIEKCWNASRSCVTSYLENGPRSEL